MFQTEPAQLPNSEFRENHCCCEPDTTRLSILVSANRPPLAQPSPPLQSWISGAPLRCIRRYGAACATAQRSIWPLGGVTARFSAERQKFWVAFCLLLGLSPCCSQSASTRTWPLRLSSSGERPRPAAWVLKPRLTS